MTEATIANVRSAMPELSDAKMERFLREYGITAYDAGVLTATRPLADYFEATVKAGAAGKSAANWISVELLRRLNDTGKPIENCPLQPARLAQLLTRMDRGEITAATGKKVFAKMFDSGKTADEIIAEEGLCQITDAGTIEKVARELIAKNPDNVAKYRSGNEGVFKFFVGQVMRETRGQANPQLVNEILKRLLA